MSDTNPIEIKFIEVVHEDTVVADGQVVPEVAIGESHAGKAVNAEVRELETAEVEQTAVTGDTADTAHTPAKSADKEETVGAADDVVVPDDLPEIAKDSPEVLDEEEILTDDDEEVLTEEASLEVDVIREVDIAVPESTAADAVQETFIGNASDAESGAETGTETAAEDAAEGGAVPEAGYTGYRREGRSRRTPETAPAYNPEEDPYLYENMTGEKVRDIAGVRFRGGGRIYYFSPAKLRVGRGTRVVVETSRGYEYGTVTGTPIPLTVAQFSKPLKPILRIATPEDDAKDAENRVKEKEAYRVAKEKITAHGLEMKLVSAEYTFDGSKIMFYFTADGRIDFRDLVKDLASVFHTRIELRQIGVRDETRILGGYGFCGRPLCCASYLSDFVPVSIKMAKEQNLSLNPAKISGVCGRLMCCLKNEEETYEDLNRNLPGVGDEVQGNDGLVGEVETVNVLRQSVRILVEVNDEKELHDYSVGDFTILHKRRRGQSRHRSPEEREAAKQINAEVRGRAQAAKIHAAAEAAKDERDRTPLTEGIAAEPAAGRRMPRRTRPGQTGERPEQAQDRNARQGNGQRTDGRGRRPDRNRRPDGRNRQGDILQSGPETRPEGPARPEGGDRPEGERSGRPNGNQNRRPRRGFRRPNGNRPGGNGNNGGNGGANAAPAGTNNNT